MGRIRMNSSGTMQSVGLMWMGCRVGVHPFFHLPSRQSARRRRSIAMVTGRYIHRNAPIAAENRRLTGILVRRERYVKALRIYILELRIKRRQHASRVA